MIVIEAVEHLPPRLARTHKVHLSQPTQLMRYRRIGECHKRGDLAYIALAFHQRGNNAQAIGVAQSVEEFGQVGEIGLLRHSLYMNTCSYIHDYQTKIKTRQELLLPYSSSGSFRRRTDWR